MTTFTDVLGTSHPINDMVLGLLGATGAGGTESAAQSGGTPGAATTIVMLGTDNGFLVRRYGANTYRLAYADDYAPGTNPRSGAPNGPGAHVYRSLQVEQLSWILNSQKWIALLEDEFSSGKYAGFAYSVDSGKTWQRSDGNTSPGDPPPMDNNQLAIGLDTETSPVDEDGRIWDIVSGANWAASSNYGLSFATQFPLTGPGSRTFWISDGYIWGIRTNQALIGDPLVLYRVSLLDGTAVSYSFSWPGSLGSSNNWAISGNYASKRLFVWAWTPSGMTHYLNIDVRDPDSPDGTWYSYSVFPSLAGSNNIVGFAPVTNQKVVAVANDLSAPTTPNTGAVYYSTDGGATWAQVIAYTPKLSYIAASGAFGVFEEMPRLSTDGHNLCVAAVPPDVFLSFDEGATWTNETVDMSIFSGYPGIAPTHWLSTAIAGPNGNIPFPGVRRRPLYIWNTS